MSKYHSLENKPTTHPSKIRVDSNYLSVQSGFEMSFVSVTETTGATQV